MLKAKIIEVEYVLPEDELSNEDLVSFFPDLTPEKIESMTGVRNRHIAKAGQCASDLGVLAAEKLLARHDRASIDYLIFCSQTPDYFLPSTACLMQERLGISNTAGAFDFTLGCSGYVQGLSLAKGLIESGQAGNVLLVTADTLTKLLEPDDRSVRLLFGDAGAATLIQGVDSDEGDFIGPFVFGTDGAGGENLIVKNGASRFPSPRADDQDGKSGHPILKMNGKEVFNFTIKEVPRVYQELLDKAGLSMDDVDKNVFHQANIIILNHLKRKIGIDDKRFLTYLREVGNTSSCTIPIVLHEAAKSGELREGETVSLVAFGVGYSWNATLIKW